MRHVLRAAGVVDAAGAWTGGATWVVQVGDVLMVCPRERAQDVRALTVALEQLGETRLL